MAIDITGLRPSRVLQALYNNTRPLGFGVLRDLGREMTEKEALTILVGAVNSAEWSFDWVQGRPIKIRIVDRASGPAHVSSDMVIEGEQLYDRDAPGGAGSCARVIAALRADPSARADLTPIDLLRPTRA